ncbi:MAG: BrnA antitoxin family protein [Stellaceae bacterium]
MPSRQSASPRPILAVVKVAKSFTPRRNRTTSSVDRGGAVPPSSRAVLVAAPFFQGLSRCLQAGSGGSHGHCGGLTRQPQGRQIAAALQGRGKESAGGELVRGGRPKSVSPKVAVSLRLDPDVLAHFRATGPGWQSRINAALRKLARLRS